MMAVTNVAPVAQWIEQLTSNLQAVGSSPAGRAKVHSPSTSQRHQANHGGRP
jgi:hypothetical protein